MKTKIFLFLSVLLGFAMASCDDDDVTIDLTPMLGADSVVTGSADVTATTATLHGTVAGLKGQASTAYTAGFNWGYDQNTLTESVQGSVDDQVITATITGLPDGATIYYQAYVTLQGKVTHTGDVKSLITTDCTMATSDAAAVSATGAKVSGSASGAPAGALYGVVIAAKPEEEAVRGGLIVAAPEDAPADFSITLDGLAPATTYYYTTYANLGSGIVYGPVKSFTTAAFLPDLDDDLVDLGLSVKWAKFNVGATAATAPGGLYGFGDLSGVNNSLDPAAYASADIYQTASDMANQAWGGSVTIPTAAQWEELFNSCTKEWTEVDGVAGYKLTATNGNSIFLPAAGSRVANEVSGAGTVGAYATGSNNGGQFYVAFGFDANGAQRSSAPVYEAMSVRPVSTAVKAPFDKKLLYTTWEIDFNEGKYVKFNGPVWFYGTDDSWRTVSNHEPVVGNSWSWEADITQTWAFGNCNGQMTLGEDGTISVTYPDGTTQTGTYTVDEADKTITSTIPLLTPDNFPGQCANLKDRIKILSLTEDGMQTGFFRDGDPATLSVNMIPRTKKYSFPVSLLCVAGDWAGTWGTVVNEVMPTDLEGKHTFKYEGAATSAMVFTLDVQGLVAAYPDAIVKIDEIRCDGKAIKFDANKFYYGDIEGNGNFRVQLFNIWGKGNQEGKVDSPFSAGGFMESDPAFNFSTSLEMDYTIQLNPVYTPCLITINKDWGGDWAYNQGAKAKIVANEASGNKMVVETPTFDITLSSAATGVDYTSGSKMTFITVDNLYGNFPGTYATLDGVWIDGKELSFDPAKIYNSNDGGAYRLELWNTYGVSSQQGCAFGTPDGEQIMELGFKDTQRVKFTFQRLFSVPQW